MRTRADWRFVGVPDLAGLGRQVVYIEWVDATGKPNENFTRDLVDRVPGGPVVLLCRSGNRLDGFEGNLDEHGHRGRTGWRAIGLPWTPS